MGICAATARLVALTLFFLAGTAAAEPAPNAEAPHQLSAADMGSFLDSFFRDQLEKYKIAGAVVSVVKDGRILFAKGYGYADIADKRPMTPDATLVRPGSISKLFTGVAVMQLVERGKLDLDRDVNDYIDFRIPTPEGGVPVTLRRLMTHRAGFENHAKDVFSANPVPQPLGPWLARSLPPRLFPQGDTSAYSNYGMALAGYIVERVSGEPFADYVERHILQPLGMGHSTFRQPLPEVLAPLMAKSYRRADQPPLPFFETITVSPAGALSATAADMGRFMIALLNEGALGNVRVLKRESLAAMMAPQVTTPAGSMGFVFVEMKHEGIPFIGHDGGTMSFFSKLLLLPRDKFGVFISYDGFHYDGDRKAAAEGDLAQAFVRRYFPPVPPEPKIFTGSAAEAQTVAGAYQTSRRADSTFLRYGALMAQALVRSHADGTVTIHPAVWPFVAGQALQPVRPGLYRGDQGGEIAPAGTMRMYAGPPAQELQRVPWWIDARFVVPPVLASVVVSVLTLLVWPVAAIWRWRKGRRFHDNPAIRRACLIARLVALLQVAVIIGFLLTLVRANNLTILNDSLDPTLLVLYALAWLGVFGAAPSLWIARLFWSERVRGVWARLHQTLLAASAVTLAWFFVVWGFAGTTLNY